MTDIQIIQTLLREFPYALFGSVVAGILCAYLGVYVVKKRVVFVGATLTQVAIAGIAFAHLPGIGMNPYAGSLLFSLIAVLIFSQLLTNRQIPTDSILGVSFVLAIALRILLVQLSPAAEVAEIDALLKGDLLFVTSDQFLILAGVTVVLLAVHLVFFKAFLFVSFDAETASTQGFRSGLWEFLFYLSVGIAVSVATRIVGDVFVFGFLVIPALSGLLVARRVRNIFLAALAFAVLPPFLGLYGAFKLDLPAGPSIVAVGGILLLMTWGARALVHRR